MAMSTAMNVRRARSALTLQGPTPASKPLEGRDQHDDQDRHRSHDRAPALSLNFGLRLLMTRGKACETHKTRQPALVKVLAQKKQDQQTEGTHHDEADQGERAGLEAHYRVRFVLPNALLHLASWAEPNIDQDLATGVGGDWINDHQYRDTIGLINWEAITANTWRLDQMTTTPPNFGD